MAQVRPLGLFLSCSALDSAVPVDLPQVSKLVTVAHGVPSGSLRRVLRTSASQIAAAVPRANTAAMSQEEDA